MELRMCPTCEQPLIVGSNSALAPYMEFTNVDGSPYATPHTEDCPDRKVKR